MPKQLAEQIDSGTNQAKQKFFTQLNEETLSQTDVLYVTRLQRERFQGENADEIVR